MSADVFGTIRCFYLETFVVVFVAWTSDNFSPAQFHIYPSFLAPKHCHCCSDQCNSINKSASIDTPFGTMLYCPCLNDLLFHPTGAVQEVSSSVVRPCQAVRVSGISASPRSTSRYTNGSQRTGRRNGSSPIGRLTKVDLDTG